jgi:hypothetical protein
MTLTIIVLIEAIVGTTESTPLDDLHGTSFRPGTSIKYQQCHFTAQTFHAIKVPDPLDRAAEKTRHGLR